MSKTVVIVDDSKFLAKQIAGFFSSRLGYEVLATGFDGNQAIELYREHRPDLITLDITMPNKDGKEAILDIIAVDPNARILMISAVKGPSMLECMKRGARGYIEKPLKFNNEEFIEDFQTTLDEIMEDELFGDNE